MCRFWSLAPRDLINLFAPDIFWRGPEHYWHDQAWLKVIYTGLLPFTVATFFVLEKGRRRLLVALLMAAALFFALGKYNPFYGHLFELIPVLHKIRYPTKFIFIFIFFIC